jgi:hypothetical protein
MWTDQRLVKSQEKEEEIVQLPGLLVQRRLFVTPNCGVSDW